MNMHTFKCTTQQVGLHSTKPPLLQSCGNDNNSQQSTCKNQETECSYNGSLLADVFVFAWSGHMEVRDTSKESQRETDKRMEEE